MDVQNPQLGTKVEASESIAGVRLEVRSANVPDVAEFSGHHAHHRLTLSLGMLPELRQCVYPTLANESYLFGRVNLIPAHLPFRIITAGGPNKRWLTVRLDPEWLAGLDYEPSDWDLGAASNIDDTFVEQSLFRLTSELLNPTLEGNILKTALCETMVRDLSRLGRKPKKNEPRQAKLSRAQFRTLLDYIESKDGTGPTTSELADVLGVSRGYLSRLFKATTGRTLHRYITIARSHKAKALLADPALPIKEVSYRLGFEQPSSFSSAFRSATGQSPSQYRASALRRR